MEEWEEYISNHAEITYRAATHNAIGFAQACFDQNTVDELEEAESGFADMSDCQTWNINEDEWRWAIVTAKYAKVHDGSISDSGRICLP